LLYGSYGVVTGDGVARDVPSGRQPAGVEVGEIFHLGPDGPAWTASLGYKYIAIPTGN